MKKVLVVVLSALMVLSVAACGGNKVNEDYVDIVWPTSDLVSRVPKPESTFGEINSESSTYFSVDLGNYTNEMFNTYISECQEAGFTVDYSKSSTSFSAYDEEGYQVWLYFTADDGELSMTISAPSEEDDDFEDVDDEDETASTTKESSATEKSTTATEAKSDDGIDSDFKEAMDAYEAFMNDYVEFMKKYQDNPTDLSLLADYATFMSDYADYSEEFAEWEDEDLNDAELAYYMEVLNRVNKKLLEVA